VLKKSFSGTLEIGAMVMMIMVGAKAFGNVLAYSGATADSSNTPRNKVSPIFVVIMSRLLFHHGMLHGPGSHYMIALPFSCRSSDIGLNPIWFGVIFLLILSWHDNPSFRTGFVCHEECGSPGDDVERRLPGGLSIVLLQIFTMALLMIFPVLALWLPGLMLK